MNVSPNKKKYFDEVSLFHVSEKKSKKYLCVGESSEE